MSYKGSLQCVDRVVSRQFKLCDTRNSIFHLGYYYFADFQGGPQQVETIKFGVCAQTHGVLREATPSARRITTQFFWNSREILRISVVTTARSILPFGHRISTA